MPVVGRFIVWTYNPQATERVRSAADASAGLRLAACRTAASTCAASCGPDARPQRPECRPAGSLKPGKQSACISPHPLRQLRVPAEPGPRFYGFPTRPVRANAYWGRNCSLQRNPPQSSTGPVHGSAALARPPSDHVPSGHFRLEVGERLAAERLGSRGLATEPLLGRPSPRREPRQHDVASKSRRKLRHLPLIIDWPHRLEFPSGGE